MLARYQALVKLYECVAGLYCRHKCIDTPAFLPALRHLDTRKQPIAAVQLPNLTLLVIIITNLVIGLSLGYY